MEDDILDIDALLKDVEAEASEAAEAALETELPAEEPEKKSQVSSEHKKKKKKKKGSKKKKKHPIKRFFAFLGKSLLILLETALLLVIVLYGVLYVVLEGPSPTARNLVTMSLRETSAMYWVPELFLSADVIADIEKGGADVEEFVETDTSLIVIQKPEDKPQQSEEDDQEQQVPGADAWGLVDEDGDGIIVEPVRGEGYSGYMMVVLDPSRVIMGSVPGSYGARGYTVAEMVEKFDAVAGINAGGFEDPDGKGNGSIPNTMVVYEGEVHYAGKGVQDGFVGFDADHIMHVGKMTAKEVQEKNIQYGVSFGPVLISNGEPANLSSGVNPRTAIGQRSDGAVLLLVIDGRQIISLGATYNDLIEIFQEYGAVNACNLDGGSSTLMWFGGDYINNCASVIGIRPVPTTFLVLKEGVTGNE